MAYMTATLCDDHRPSHLGTSRRMAADRSSGRVPGVYAAPVLDPERPRPFRHVCRLIGWAIRFLSPSTSSPAGAGQPPPTSIDGGGGVEGRRIAVADHATTERLPR